MPDEGRWQAVLHSGVLSANRQWYDRGRNGPGQLVLEGENLRGVANIRTLRGARFVRCDFACAALGRCMLDDVELRGCIFSDGAVTESDFTRALIEDCAFDRANLIRTYFVDAKIRLGSFRGANLLHTRWTGAEVVGAVFRGASLREATLDGAHFSDCDFGDADLENASVVGTTFERCRFDGARGVPRAGIAPWAPA